MSDYIRNIRLNVGTELIMMPCVSGIVRDDHGHVLVQRRSDNGKWSLPGGSIDLCETPSQAVVREMWEETGLQVVPDWVRGVFGGKDYRVVYPNGDRVEYTCIVFECKRIGGELSALDGESLELRFIAPGDLPDLGFPYPKEIFVRGYRQTIWI